MCCLFKKEKVNNGKVGSKVPDPFNSNLFSSLYCGKGGEPAGRDLRDFWEMECGGLDLIFKLLDI